MNNANRTSATCQHEVSVKNIRLTSVASCKLHFESNQSQNSLRKASCITNSLLRRDTHRCFLLWRRGRLRLCQLESANCTLPHSKWLPCTAIGYGRGLSIKNLFQRIKLTKGSGIKNIFHLTNTKNTDLFIELWEHTQELDSLMIMTTDQLLWRHKNVFPPCHQCITTHA